MRKKIEVNIEDNGEQLLFIIEQMPATRMQKFILKAMPLLGQLKGLGGLAEGDLSALAGINPVVAEALIEELYTCVQRKVGGALVQVNAQNIDGMLSTVGGLFTLQQEVVKLNFDFLAGGELSTMPTIATAANTFNMRTSAAK